MLTLQWGHALARVESRQQARAASKAPPLQWGHALARVESISLRRCRERLVIASMGPRARARGIAVIDPRLRIGIMASMGPRARARGIPPTPGSTPVNGFCFNGATRSRAWNRAPTARLDRRAMSFNGATRSRA